MGALAAVFISTADAAAMLGFKQATLRRWRIERKHLQPHKVGSRWRYNRDEVLQFLNAGRLELPRGQRQEQ